MRLQVREAHFLEMFVVLALLNSLGKDRAYPRLPISCPSPIPTPKSHSNEYSTPHRKRSSSMLHELVGGVYWGKSRFCCATE